jgi:hypothetical protein
VYGNSRVLMANVATLPAQAPTSAPRSACEDSVSIPWYAWTAVLAATAVIVGLYWDISWHETIGRDTFWTPAHLCIQFCAVLSGFSCGYLILSTTFSHDPTAKETSVRIWGFYGPLGAFVAAWGGVAMITSAPFDNWWHNAYGLDVEILSPPHVLLAIGITAIAWGNILLVLARMNRAADVLRRNLQWVLLYLAGTIVILDMILKLEYSSRVLMHSAVFYKVMCIALPFAMVALARASRHRWAMTIMAAVYSLFNLLMLWILPLFPAQPKLGPVYQHTTHMDPLYFPVLLVAPAFVLDIFWPRMESWNRWLQAAAAGSLFLIVLVAIQWPVADFLMTPAAHNWFFGSQYVGYFQGMDDPEVRNVFVPFEATRGEFWITMAWALVAAIVSVRIGITWGNWLRQARR